MKIWEKENGFVIGNLPLNLSHPVIVILNSNVIQFTPLAYSQSAGATFFYPVRPKGQVVIMCGSCKFINSGPPIFKL